MTMDIYREGFAAKCAELGVDAKQLAKTAQMDADSRRTAGVAGGAVAGAAAGAGVEMAAMALIGKLVSKGKVSPDKMEKLRSMFGNVAPIVGGVVGSQVGGRMAEQPREQGFKDKMMQMIGR